MASSGNQRSWQQRGNDWLTSVAGDTHQLGAAKAAMGRAVEAYRAGDPVRAASELVGEVAATASADGSNWQGFVEALQGELAKGGEQVEAARTEMEQARAEAAAAREEAEAVWAELAEREADVERLRDELDRARQEADEPAMTEDQPAQRAEASPTPDEAAAPATPAPVDRPARDPLDTGGDDLAVALLDFADDLRAAAAARRRGELDARSALRRTREGFHQARRVMSATQTAELRALLRSRTRATANR